LGCSREATSAEQPEADVFAEGRRVLDGAAKQNVPLRLLGGVAVRLRAGTLPASLERTPGDIDVVAKSGMSGRVQTLFKELGYEPHTSFNALNGKGRLLFFDDAHGRQVDVFVGSFKMCHEVPIRDRLEVDETSIPLAELLLTKLQVVELNEKDVRDAIAILHGRELSTSDGESVNTARLANLLAADWGLWRTITSNLKRCRELVRSYENIDHDRIEGQLDELHERIESEPKSRAWRLRAKIGERKRWYDLPEERA
jgi:hypothetical protein